MPFVDLSNSTPQPLTPPTQVAQGIAASTPIDPSAVVTPPIASVANTNSDLNAAATTIANDIPVVPPSNPIAEIKDPEVPVVNILPSNPPKTDVSNDEHSLMRDLPSPQEIAPVADNGVREIAGPPPQIPAEAVNPIAETIANPQVVPAVQMPENVPQEITPQVPVMANAVELTGSAVNDAQKVKDILQNADNLISQKSPAVNPNEGAPTGTPAKPLELKTTTADEKFIAERASINDLLSVAEKHNASDLHLSVGYPPILRVDGDLMNLGGQVINEDRIKELFSQILSKQQSEQLEKYLDVDFSYTHTSGTRFRVNLYHKSDSLAGAFRLIPSRIRTIAELGLPEVFYDLVKIPQGLVILAGPTGSGKSTTIASMIQEINLNQPRHILTLEDPIEYIFPKGKALINQREIGTDALNFKRALREVLREDPDVVLVGEMRDFETIAATITTAETGHLVFSTLHTNSASQTVDRMIDVFPEAQQSQVRAQLANVISAVISQRLIPVKGGGRKAALEIMIATPAIRNAIREAKTYQIDNMIQTNSELGMVTLEKALIEMIRRGEITLETAQEFTTKPEELISLMKSN